MFYDGYGIEIRGGTELEDRYVQIEHGTQFSLVLFNQTAKRVDAAVKVNGLPAGTFRVQPFAQIVLERPSGSSKRFTFFEENSAEARAQRILPGAVDNGVISVEFIPEKTPVQVVKDQFGYPKGSVDWAQPMTSVQYRATSANGVVGYTGKSSQKFTDADAIERDLDAAVTIALRLIPAPRRRVYPAPPRK